MEEIVLQMTEAENKLLSTNNQIEKLIGELDEVLSLDESILTQNTKNSNEAFVIKKLENKKKKYINLSINNKQLKEENEKLTEFIRQISQESSNLLSICDNFDQQTKNNNLFFHYILRLFYPNFLRKYLLIEEQLHRINKKFHYFTYTRNLNNMAENSDKKHNNDSNKNHNNGDNNSINNIIQNCDNSDFNDQGYKELSKKDNIFISIKHISMSCLIPALIIYLSFKRD